MQQYTVRLNRQELEEIRKGLAIKVKYIHKHGLPVYIGFMDLVSKIDDLLAVKNTWSDD